MGYGVGVDALGILDDGNSLESALGADGDGVGVVAEDVAVDHEADTFIVVFLLYIEGLMGFRTKGERPFFDGFAFLGSEPAGVCQSCMNLIAKVNGKIFYGKGGV